MKILDVPRSGSYQAITSSKNRAGQYVRNRRSPVQPPGTGRRAIVRGNFTTGSTSWASLSSTNQDAWNSFAAAHPVTDRLGQTITLTGHQMFIRCYTSLINVGGTPSVTPPTSTATDLVAPVTFTFSAATGISLAWVSGTTGNFIACAFSGPMSPGVRFNKTFWQPFGTDGYDDAAATPKTITTAIWAAQFGTAVIGQRVFCRVTPVNQFGFNGSPTIVSALITT